MLYEKPKMEILELKTVDVICASVGDVFDGTGGNSTASGSWVPPTH